ncbi:MAG: hypothetical protein Q8Q00_12410 [Dehalococcoidia bacterium]|nr:hypothetical protein [Dehalococcoidia bacterium]
MSEQPVPKIAPYAFPERYVLPGRPTGEQPAVQDAHRQTHFLLPAELALFEQAMNLQLAIVAAGTKKRSAEAAALLGFWSRTFSYLSDACTLLGRASYASSPPLLRAACDCIAAQRSLIADGFAEYHEWLASALGKDREHAASYIELGRFRAGSVLAQDERLGSAYRFLTDLTMPHFGSTLFQAGPESSQQKLALAIGESAFHLGLAELVSGWLLLLAGAQTEAALSGPFVEPTHPLREEAARLRNQIEEALASPRRCRAEELPDGRRLIHNFRRAVSGAPRRVLL